MAKLDTLVSSFGEHDAQAKELKKICDSEKTEIKDIMSKGDMKEYSAGGYTVKYSISHRENLNEGKMLEILKKDWQSKYGNEPCPYIKTAEYVDMDELEAVLYANELSDDVLADLDKCREVTEIVKLTCSKEKKKKED